MHRTSSVAAIVLVVAAAIGGIVAGSSARLTAQQGATTANMRVSANVIRKCTLATQPLDFGTYDPVQTNRVSPLDGQSMLTVACTKGTSVSISLDNGTNALGRRRQMSGDGKEQLEYELYKDAARRQRWGDSFGERYDAGVAPSRDPRQFTVYGRVPGGQDVPEGDFQDTVLVTVQF